MKRMLLLMCALVLITAAVGFLNLRSRTYPPISAAGGAMDLNGVISGIPHWRQDDPVWATETLGGSGESMGRAGCTITSVAMALHALQIVMTPPEVCRALKTRSGFTTQGHLIWKTVEELTDGKVHVTFPPLSHTTIDESLRQRNPVIAKIMIAGEIPHWILIVGKQGQDYLAIDPLNTTATPVAVATLSKQLHAIRILQRD